MVILITGAFGFVGRNLSAYLARRGHEVWGLDLLRPRSGRDGEGEKCGNALMRECLNEGENAQHSSGKGAYARCFGWEELENIPWGEVDAVVHLAGKAHDTRNASDPQSYFEVNVGLTKKILESAIGSWQLAMGEGSYSRQDAKAQREEDSSIPGKKFIFFSSVKAVADRVEGVLTEEVAPDPKTPYGQSKLEAEEAVQSAMGNRQSAIKSYILRPCMIHGPGNKGNLNLLYGLAKKGLPWPLGAFENRRSFASVGNVCAVVEGLLKGDVEPGVYQVADDEVLSTNELVGLMAESLGRKAKVWKVPAAWVRALARIGDLLRLPLNSERLRKLTESYVASNAKIKTAMGLEKMPIRAREGMRMTLESFSRQGAKTQSEEIETTDRKRNDRK